MDAPTPLSLTHFHFKVRVQDALLIGKALGELPFREVNPLLQDLERQLQEQKFKAEQADIQAKVAEANAEALAIAAANPAAEPPTVSLEECGEPLTLPLNADGTVKMPKLNGAGQSA